MVLIMDLIQAIIFIWACRMEQNYKNDWAGFLIFTFNVDVIHSLSFHVLLLGSHSIAMFAAHTLCESNSPHIHPVYV